MINFYRGVNARYVDIGSRGTDCLGLGIQYEPGSDGVGYVVVRFVVHSDPLNGQIGPFNHFQIREPGKYVTLNDDGSQPDHAEMFRGFRLNKVAVPVFTPAVQSWKVIETGTQLQSLPKLAAWILDQAQQDNFVVPGGDEAVLEVIHRFLTVEQPPVEVAVDPQDAFQTIDLKAQKQQGSHHHFVPDDDDPDPNTLEKDDPDDDPEDDDEGVE